MRIRAKINLAQNQIRIMKQLSSGEFRVSLSDAKHAYKTNRIVESNKAFRLLAANDFDVQETITMYRKEKT